MAYDLTVTGFAAGKEGARARDALKSLVDRSGGESWGRDGSEVGIGMGRLDAKKAARFYAAFVKLAAGAGLSVHDPQAGQDIDLDAPGELPPGWSPPQPMDAEHFQRAVQRYATGRLAPLGYQVYAWGAQRFTDEGHLLQRLAFRSHRDLFTLLVDWRFFFDGEEDASWPAPYDVGDFMAGTPLEAQWPVALCAPRWGQLSAAPSDLDASLAHVDRALTARILPWLGSIDTIDKLVAAFEDNRSGQIARQMKEPGRPHRDAFSMAFGYDPVGAARNMALSYRRLGRLADGKARYAAQIATLGDPRPLLMAAEQKKLEAAQALFG